MKRPEAQRVEIPKADRPRVAAEVLMTYQRPDGEHFLYAASVKRCAREIIKLGYYTRLVYPPSWSLARILEWHDEAEHVLRLRRAGAL